MQRLSASSSTYSTSTSDWTYAFQRAVPAPSSQRFGGLFAPHPRGARWPQHQSQTCGAVPSVAAGTSTKSSRKALKQLFKQHRKRLESVSLDAQHSNTSAFSTACAASTVLAPVLTDLVSQLRALSLQLERSPGLERYLPDDGSAADCTTRSVGKPSSALRVSTLPVADIAVPALDFDDDAFSEMQFSGSGRVLVCQGSKCRALGAGQVLAAASALSSNSPGIEVVPCKCVGKCKEGPALRIRPEGQACAVYTRVEPARLPEVWGTHFSAPAPPACAHSSLDCCVECEDGSQA